jgi:hypothetical protein
MDVGVMERPAAAGQTVTVSAADSGRMLSLRVGDRLVLDVPVGGDVQWRLRGAEPVMMLTPPQAGTPPFVLIAVRSGRVGVDLVPSSPLPRPIRLIVCVS